VVYVVIGNILAVDIGERADSLRELPVRLMVAPGAAMAKKVLRTECVDAVLSSWEVFDTRGRRLVEEVASVFPDMPTIVLVPAGRPEMEADARRGGSSVVFPEDVEGQYLEEAVWQVLSVKDAQRDLRPKERTFGNRLKSRFKEVPWNRF
jgi:DNA-binding NtrC family response regulator